MDSFSDRRRDMIETQIAARGIVDRSVLAAMLAVPREAFLPASMEEFAYDDTPLPIEGGQTISQPYVVALKASALGLTPPDRVLEVGAGSGYAAAVLSHIARAVYTIERHEALAELASRRLKDFGFANVYVLHGDGMRQEVFSRFPTWMWRNQEVHEFVDWLRDHNEEVAARLPRQFDEYVWIDRTSAVTPLGRVQVAGMPATHPFGV